MSTKKLLALTGIFLALFGFVVFYERHQPTSEERERARRKLIDVKAADVTAVVIERKDLPKVDLRKGPGGKWTVAGEAADQAAVDGLLADLDRLDLVGETRTEFDAKEFGLDHPRARVLLTWKDGRTADVLVGSEIPGAGATAAASGGKFGAIRFAPVATLAKPLDDFRSRSLLEVPPAEITRLSVARGSARIVAVRDPAPPGGAPGPWRLEEPVKDLAAGAFVEQFLADLGSTRVSEFPPVPPAGLQGIGLQPPGVTVTVQKGSEPPISLAFGAARAEGKGKLWARREQTLVVVDDRVQEDFGKELSAWREGKAIPFDPWGVKRVSVESGTMKAAAEKVESEWRGAGRTVDAASVTDLLDRLSRIEVRAFVPRKDAARFGVASLKATPFARVEVAFEKGGDPLSARAWPASPVDGKPALAVEATGRAELMLVDRAAWDEVLVAAEKVRLGAPPPKGARPVRTPPGAAAFPPAGTPAAPAGKPAPKRVP